MYSIPTSLKSKNKLYSRYGKFSFPYKIHFVFYKNNDDDDEDDDNDDDDNKK